LESKKYIILKHMLDQDSYNTSEELSILIKVSPRTIMRYMKDINYTIKKYNAEIISAKGLGYLLQVSEKKKKEIKEMLVSLTSDPFDDTDEARNEKIIRCLLNEKENTIEKLGLALNLSPARIIQLIDVIRKRISDYDLELVSKKNSGLTITGKESDIRTLILDILLDKSDEKLVDLFGNLSLNEINEVKRITQKNLAEADLFISDFDFKLFCLEILIALSRCKKSKGIGNESLERPRKIILTTMSEISFITGINIGENEKVYIDKELGEILDGYNTKGNDEVTAFINDVLMQFENTTGKKYLEDAQLVNSLKLHIGLFIKRAKRGIETSNQIIAEIKKNLPVEFDLAALMGIQIEKSFNVHLSESEIGFLTLHFASYEERRKSKERKKIVIICHYGIGTSQLLKEKILSRYEEFTIVGVYPVAFMDVALKQDAEIIVSTVEINDYLNKPVIYIENIFSNDIFDMIDKVLYKKSKMEKTLHALFDKETFMKINANSRKDVIEKMGERLISKGYTTIEVINEVFKREDMSSTDIGNLVAIPHTISHLQDKSFISVGILENQVFWSKGNVQLVFLICFNRNDTENLDVFKYLYNFIKDEGAVKSIINFADHDVFMNIVENIR
jgi:lichenan operon transcriptional antiterminator